jgi:hypothetical protein
MPPASFLSSPAMPWSPARVTPALTPDKSSLRWRLGCLPRPRGNSDCTKSSASNKPKAARCNACCSRRTCNVAATEIWVRLCVSGKETTKAVRASPAQHPLPQDRLRHYRDCAQQVADVRIVDNRVPVVEMESHCGSVASRPAALLQARARQRGDFVSAPCNERSVLQNEANRYLILAGGIVLTASGHRFRADGFYCTRMQASCPFWSKYPSQVLA